MSSLSPGCSPTNTTFAVWRPSPNTVCVAFFHRSHARQCAAASRHAPRLLVSGSSGYRWPASGVGAGGSGSATRLDGASPAPEGPDVRAALVVVAVVALVGIGTVDAFVSNDQISQLPGRTRPALSAGGTALTVLGLALSAIVYAALGLWLWPGGVRGRAVPGVGMSAGRAVRPIAGTA